jgi:hypothetical protein
MLRCNPNQPLDAKRTGSKALLYTGLPIHGSRHLSSNQSKAWQTPLAEVLGDPDRLLSTLQCIIQLSIRGSIGAFTYLLGGFGLLRLAFSDQHEMERHHR